MGAALTLGGAGCVDDPAADGGEDAPGASGQSVLGGWALASQATCQETLAFEPDGRFVHGVALTLPGLAAHVRVAGRYSGGTTTDGQGSLAIQLSPDAPAYEPALAYCDGWAAATQRTLPFPDLAAVAGVAPGDLRYRSVPLNTGGVAWIGTDAGHVERLALVRDGNVLRGFLLGPFMLFHRVPSTLTVDPLFVGPRRVVNLPQETFVRTFPAQADVGVAGQLILNVHEAVDVTFGPPLGTALPVCTLHTWGNLGFSEFPPPAFDPLQGVGGANETRVALNPADPALPFSLVQSPAPGGVETRYLLPISSLVPGEEGCGLSIHARPLAARIVEDLLAQSAAGDAFAPIVLGGGPAYLLAAPEGQPELLRLLPLEHGDPLAAWRLTGALVQPPTSLPDPLGLRVGGGAVRLSVQAQAEHAVLNVFSEARGSLGPFLPQAPPAPSVELRPPDELPVRLDAATPRTIVGLTLTAAGGIVLESVGGASATAALFDARGDRLAHARGAADGADFRIVAALGAGDYRLAVTAGTLPAQFTLRASPLVAPAVADARLEACLRSALPSGSEAGALHTADCTGLGIASLAGIGAYGELRALRLSYNRVSDLSPLAEHPLPASLRVLSLAGNPLADLTPLTHLLRLHSLSLAGTGLGQPQLATLRTLAERLRFLDLRGAQGVSAGDVDTLAVAMPFTFILAPDGASAP